MSAITATYATSLIMWWPWQFVAHAQRRRRPHTELVIWIHGRAKPEPGVERIGVFQPPFSIDITAGPDTTDDG
jgi:hypothetical protein